MRLQDHQATKRAIGDAIDTPKQQSVRLSGQGALNDVGQVQVARDKSRTVQNASNGANGVKTMGTTQKSNQSAQNRAQAVADKNSQCNTKPGLITC